MLDMSESYYTLHYYAIPLPKYWYGCSSKKTNMGKTRWDV